MDFEYYIEHSYRLLLDILIIVTDIFCNDIFCTLMFSNDVL